MTGTRSTSGPRRDARDSATSRPESEHTRPESRIERIVKRAHEIYQARGGEHGKALDDWLQAEREVDAEMEQQTGTKD